MARNSHEPETTETTEDMGVFGFAQKTAQLLVPMGIIAGLFGLWLRSEMVMVRSEFKDAIAVHALAETGSHISRAEFDAFKATIQKQNEDQSRMIQRNTIFLERISQKLGIPRPPE